MKNIEILEKVICKVKGYPYGCVVFPDILKNNKYYRIIFSYDFAKKFWGTEEVDSCGRTIKQAFELIKEHFIDFEDFEIDCWGTNEYPVKEAWKYHLQQMVLEKEPLKYLEKFL